MTRLTALVPNIVAGLGFAAPLIAAFVPNFRWWLGFFLAGLVAFAVAFSILLAAAQSADPGGALDTALGIILLLPAAICFAVSFAVKAYWLVTSPTRKPDHVHPH
jgi:hypothetical protein